MTHFFRANGFNLPQKPSFDFVGQRLTGSVSGRIAGAARCTCGSRCCGGGAGLRSATPRRRGTLRHYRHAQTGGQQDGCNRTRGYRTLIHACPFSAQNPFRRWHTQLASILVLDYCNSLAKAERLRNNIYISFIVWRLARRPASGVDILATHSSSVKRALFSSWYEKNARQQPSFIT